MQFTLSFLQFFFQGLYLISPLLLFFAVIICGLGLISGKIEGWNKINSLYWAFVTATTVGYGDIRPSSKRVKGIAIVLAIIGMMFTGIIIAATVHTASLAFDIHIKPYF